MKRGIKIIPPLVIIVLVAIGFLNIININPYVFAGIAGVMALIGLVYRGAFIKILSAIIVVLILILTGGFGLSPIMATTMILDKTVMSVSYILLIIYAIIFFIKAIKNPYAM